MVYVTGDTHGWVDIQKLEADVWPEGQRLRRSDLVVICGDFGLVWEEPPSFENRFFLDWLNRMPWTTLFVDGNHENHDLLDAMPVTTWRGGKIHRLPGFPNIIHLMRGQVYEMGCDGTWFVMGGAPSQDHGYRVEGESWWPREMPSAEEYAEARRNLDANGWSVDYVFTHECPTRYKRKAMERWYNPERLGRNELSEFLDEVDVRLNTRRMKQWYFGHYHDDLALPGGRHALLYQQIVPLGAMPELRPAGYRAFFGISPKEFEAACSC